MEVKKAFFGKSTASRVIRSFVTAFLWMMGMSVLTSATPADTAIPICIVGACIIGYVNFVVNAPSPMREE